MKRLINKKSQTIDVIYKNDSTLIESYFISFINKISYGFKQLFKNGISNLNNINTIISLGYVLPQYVNVIIKDVKVLKEKSLLYIKIQKKSLRVTP
jgi:hypothetical protein